MTFESNDKYFGGAPAAKKLTMRVIPEMAARMAALINGEVDLVTNVPPDQVGSLKAKKELVVAQVPLANIHVMRFNMKVKPMDNKFIRQAVYARDRPQDADRATLGRQRDLDARLPVRGRGIVQPEPPAVTL